MKLVQYVNILSDIVNVISAVAHTPTEPNAAT